MKPAFNTALRAPVGPKGYALSDEQVSSKAAVRDNGSSAEIGHGAVVIAALTSCTNTSNPSVMVAAGLLAKKAVEKGLNRKPYVKTSLAPGSKVVTEYLDKAGLTEYLEKIGFYTVGYGCTTCIGNSGPLPEPVREAIYEGDLVAAAVLSGNRNFAGRIGPDVRANYLASPPLVVAYALAGTVDVDLNNDPIGQDENGADVYLKDIWPTQKEILDVIQTSLSPDMFNEQYGNVYNGNEMWNEIPSTDEAVYQWDEDSPSRCTITPSTDCPPQSLWTTCNTPNDSSRQPGATAGSPTSISGRLAPKWEERSAGRRTRADDASRGPTPGRPT
jgi:aconitate hydratase